jgi:GT2 family glycosyltransferase
VRRRTEENGVGMNAERVRKKKKLVSLVIVNYNGKGDSIELLESLKMTDYPNYEIIFVDNASADDSVQVIKRKFPYAKIVENKENLGYAGGMNRGIQASKGDYIVLLNNDMVVFQKDWLTKLVDVAESDEKIGVVRGLFLYYKTDVIDTIGQMERNAVLRLINPYLPLFKREKYDGVFREFVEISGGNGLVKRKVFDTVGLLDEKMFIYFEEIDFCHRAGKAGFKMVSITSSKLWHKGSNTIRKNTYFSTFHNYKNKLRFYLKNYDPISKMFAMILNLSFYMGLMVFYAAKGRYDLSKALRDAIYWNILNWRDYVKARHFKF